ITICTSPYFVTNQPATTKISSLSLHDALPISDEEVAGRARLASELVQDGADLVMDVRELVEVGRGPRQIVAVPAEVRGDERRVRSEEHTSELQSRENLVCRLLLEKKNTIT